MTFPALFEVGFKAFIEGSKNAHGNPTKQWGEVETRKVIGWGAPQSSEPKLAGHDRDIVEIELAVPADWKSTPRDRIILPDLGEMEQIGITETNSGNPFRWVPGHIVNLRQVNG